MAGSDRVLFVGDAVPVEVRRERVAGKDPIRRERLQNEFLRLQEQVRKTIIFVTHDIDEAILLGDRVAALRSSSRRRCAWNASASSGSDDALRTSGRLVPSMPQG